MAKQDVVALSTVLAWVEDGNFTHDGEIVSSEDLRGKPSMVKLARAAYAKAVNPETEEEKTRKKVEARTATFALFSASGELLASESVPNNQRLLKDETHQSYRDSAEMEDGSVLLVLVSDSEGTTVEGKTAEEILALITR